MRKLIVVALVVFVVVAGARAAWTARAVADDGAIYAVTHVDVIPPFADAGRGLLKQLAVDSRKDAGSIRFEVLEQLSRGNHSTIVEVWKDQKSYDGHLEAEHTRAFRTKLQPMLGSPLDERLYHLSSAGAEP